MVSSSFVDLICVLGICNLQRFAEVLTGERKEREEAC